MVQNPSVIILEILDFLLRTTINTIIFISKKLTELFFSLSLLGSPMEIFIGSVIGGAVLYFIGKYLFGTTKTLVVVLVLYVLLVLAILLV